MDAETNRPSAAPGNYVRISRELEDHPVVGFGQSVKPADTKRGSYSRAEAWLFLVFQARWKSAEVNNRGKVMLLERGELLGARAWLAKTWNWTENQVKGFLDKLEAEMMINRKSPHLDNQQINQSNHQKAARFVNIISICNYSIYQMAIEAFCEEKHQSTTNRNTDKTTDKTTDQPPHINKGKEDNITTVENNNLGLPSLSDGQHEGIFWNENGHVQAVNGSRAPLEKLLGEAANLDQVLVEISPRLPDKAAGQDLALALAAAVAEHKAELEKTKTKRGKRLPRDWVLPKSWGEWAMTETKLDAPWVRDQAAQFKDYWISKSGTTATKLDWPATWRNWVRNAKKPTPGGGRKFEDSKGRDARLLDLL